jgi:hypothetical protein
LAEVSFDDLSNLTPTWTNLTSRFLEGSFQRGNSGVDLDEPQAGTASFTFANRDRRFEPEYAASPYFPTVKPLRRIRLSIDGTLSFTGYIMSWGVEWPDALINQEAVVTAWDAHTILALDTLPGLDPPDATTYAEVMNFDEPAFYYRLGEPQGTKLVAHVRGKGKKRRRWRTRETVAELGGVSGPSGTYKNTPTLGVPGAIVGDTDTAVLFTASQSEYARVQLDQSDLIDSNRLTLECWYKPTSVAADAALIVGPLKSAANRHVFALTVAAGGVLNFAFDTMNRAQRPVNPPGGGPVRAPVGHWQAPLPECAEHYNGWALAGTFESVGAPDLADSSGVRRARPRSFGTRRGGVWADEPLESVQGRAILCGGHPTGGSRVVRLPAGPTRKE